MAGEMWETHPSDPEISISFRWQSSEVKSCGFICTDCNGDEDSLAVCLTKPADAPAWEGDALCAVCLNRGGE